jgi:hypothetical protein
MVACQLQGSKLATPDEKTAAASAAEVSSKAITIIGCIAGADDRMHQILSGLVQCLFVQYIWHAGSCFLCTCCALLLPKWQC